MKKALNKSMLICFIFVMVLISGGCQNLFIPNNIPVILRNEQPSEKASSQNIRIESYGIISPGIAQDITNSGNNLLLFNSDMTYNIDTYNTDTLQLSSFISSDKKILTALYDTYDTGIYYVEEMIDPINNNIGSQIIWSDINKNITRVISLPEENVIKYFGIGDSGHVIYANNNNQIVLADSEGNRQVYDVLNNYNILAVDYINEEKGFLIIAIDPKRDEKTNLYYAKIKADSMELTPDLIAENVNTFDINDFTNQVVFVKSGGNIQTIRTWKTDAGSPAAIATGNFGSVVFTPNGENIVYTQHTPNYDSHAESIWIIDPNGQDPLQLTAPVNLNSKVICHPSKPILYFSVEKSPESISSIEDQTLSQIFQLTYKIN